MGNGFALAPSRSKVASAVSAILTILLMNAASANMLNPVLAQKSDSSDSETQSAAVTIPKGAANPEVDLTLQKVGNWYKPAKTTISVGDTVTWKNEDTEGHTVTSGLGAGIQSVQTNEKGKADGIFDSGLFKPGESWSRTFYNPGTYSYFCTIHPWMEGVVIVNPAQASNIPTYPVDASGNKQREWPVHTLTKDGKYDIDLGWDKAPILTGETVTFIANFYIMPANLPTEPTQYDFVVVQNGKELDRLYALTSVGQGVHKYQFSKAGPITIRIENVGGKPQEDSKFTTIVYPNPAQTSNNDGGATRVSGGTEPVSRFINPLTLVWFTYGVVFSLPAAVAAVIILFKKGKI